VLDPAGEVDLFGFFMFCFCPSFTDILFRSKNQNSLTFLDFSVIITPLIID